MFFFITLFQTLRRVASTGGITIPGAVLDAGGSMCASAIAVPVCSATEGAVASSFSALALALALVGFQQ